jgi:OmpA-OmpF porin, OOP family
LLCLGIMIGYAQGTLTTERQDLKKVKHFGTELGLLGGFSLYTGDAHCEKFLFKNSLNLAGGAFFRYYLSDAFAVRANFLAGKIKGDDRNYPGLEHGNRNFKFTSNVFDATAILDFEPFAKRRYRGGKFHRIFSPYVFVGAGIINANPNTDYNETNNFNIAREIAEDKANTKKTNLTIPFGLGWKFDLTERLVLGGEVSYRNPFSDYLDGISKAGNPDAKDWYETGTFTLAYRLKYMRDADKDGIADDQDACPNEAGTLRGKGCPDQDADGVVDRMDNCPTEQGSPALNGCPDKDGDGIADKDDTCPDYAGDAADGGCPDKDGDGIIDMKDDCPEVSGLVALNGCPDTDGDGITDKADGCPTQKGSRQDNGCPPRDTDKDGVADRDDKCPEEVGTISNNGCPEVAVPAVQTSTVASASSSTVSSSSSSSNVTVGSNAVVTGRYVDYSSAENLSSGTTYRGNGVEVDPRNLITSTVTVAEPTYTGTITTEETAVFDEALYGIQFETGSATITAGSFSILNRVFEVMQRRGGFNFEIGGHTDNVGNSVTNQRLSESRAKAVYNYLVRKGISGNRLTFVGYGDTNPVADNSTTGGRAKNRRVQFTLR